MTNRDRKQIKLIKNYLNEACKINGLTGLDRKAVIELVRRLQKTRKIPNYSESLCISIGNNIKSSALFFDKVHSNSLAENAPPDGIRAFIGTNFEILALISATLGKHQAKKRTVIRNDMLEFYACSLEFYAQLGYKDRMVGNVMENYLRLLSEVIYQEHGISSTVVYHSSEARDIEYKEGSSEVVLASIDNLNIVDEKSLSWDQVMQFRDDKEAKLKYRRMMLWLNTEMIGRTQNYIEDAIAVKLDDYEHALKKHGIKAVLGFLSCMLDWKAIVAASPPAGGLIASGEPIWGTALGAGLVIGQAAVKVAQKGLDLDDTKRGKNSEIAYVYEIKKQLNK